MGVDEPGNDDVAGSVDDAGIIGRQIRADRCDRAILDEDVRVG